MSSNTDNGRSINAKGLAAAAFALIVVMAFLFQDSFKSGQVHFANDGPLGVMMSHALELPQMFKGFWMDLYWLGINGKYATVSVTYGITWLLGPVGFAKFYDPICQVILGLCAWAFFRSLGLRTALSTVGALAAALNMNFFSHTCWGLGTRSLTLAAMFLALAALTTRRAGNRWMNAILAGLCVGLGVIEGADNGAIFSLFIAAFVVFQALVEEETVVAKVKSATRVVLVAVFAGLIAAQVMITLLGIASSTGSVAKQQDQQSPEARWDFATQWSLPKLETLRVAIPGMFGYRMDTAEGGAYWGRVGEAPSNPAAMPRYSGAGEYAGVMVLLVAAWAFFMRKNTTAFTPLERKFIWFWTIAALVALVFAWGRHAPFYRFVYALPYFSTIRNPLKFMHPFHLSMLVLFGYGLLGLSRLYLSEKIAAQAISWSRVKAWLGKALPVERRWVYGSLALCAASLLGYLAYSTMQGDVVKHLASSGFPDTGMALSIARHSAKEVGLFFLFLTISVVLVILVMSGAFSGKRAVWMPILFGIVVVADLARANAPWILHYDYQAKYESNPIIDILREKPYEQRVSAPPFLISQSSQDQTARLFPSIYQVEWLQHHFQYYNIPALEMAQEPRPPAEKTAYLNAVGKNPTRYWELSNTRYVLGMTGFLNPLNSQIDQGRNRFRVRATFDFVPKPGIANPTKLEELTAVLATNGPLALFEFTGALPRTRLYPQWQVETNDDAALTLLASPTFDPAASVVVNDPFEKSSASTNAPAGDASIISYAPTRVEIRATNTAPAILLLNDRHDPEWNVTVDGQPARLLRCNYIMRGVPLPPGQHTVVFHFQPSLRGMKVTVASFALGIVLSLMLFFVHPSKGESNAGDKNLARK